MKIITIIFKSQFYPKVPKIKVREITTFWKILRIKEERNQGAASAQGNKTWKFGFIIWVGKGNWPS